MANAGGHLGQLASGRWWRVAALVTAFGVLLACFLRTGVLVLKNRTPQTVLASVRFSGDANAETVQRAVASNASSVVFLRRANQDAEQSILIEVVSGRESARLTCGYVDGSPTAYTVVVSRTEAHLDIRCHHGVLRD